MTPTQARTRAPERFVRRPLTWAAYGLVGYFAYLETVLGPLMPFLRAERGLTYTVASLHFSAFAAGGVVAGFGGDKVVARWGRSAALWGGALGMAAGAVLVAASPATAGTVLGALVMGTFGALVLLTTQAVLADSHGRHRAVAITESNVAASACAIVASLAVGAGAAIGLGWRAALLAPLVAAAVLWRRYGGESPGLPAVPGRIAGRGGRLPARFWVLWTVLFLGVAVEWSVAYWGSDFLVTSAGLRPSQAAAALSAYFVAMLAGRAAGSRLARRASAHRLLLASLCVALSAFPLLWLPASAALKLAGLFGVGLGVANVYPLAVSAGVAEAPGASDVAAARFGIAGGGAGLLAPFVLGSFADRVGIEAAFGISVPMLVVAVALAALSNRRRASGARAAGATTS